MFPEHPMLYLSLSHDQHDELLREADHRRLVRAVRAAEKASQRRHRSAGFRQWFRTLLSPARPDASVSRRVVETDDDHSRRDAA